MLELRDVVKTYVSGDEHVRAAAGISLTVAAGELVALYGPSGSGKTTLLLLAAGILRPDGGQVHFEGRDVAALSEREASAYRMHDVGIVFQSFHLIPGATALDNASVKLLGRGSARRDARRRAQPWLDRVGVGSKAARHPARLSAGERQRVAVARALANDPKLLLADEPTGNLDSESGRAVLALLAEICHSQGLAVVLATHDPAALDFADRALQLRDGMLSDHVPATQSPARRAASEAP
ncbi:MAG TPA: ABC transporter ATP-binding protein [Conexibacter sp.]|jgi:putative ABC transport system ATP-binding protein|nr:ABC transporter ATP-binding protein [Conexibacter sp.]